MSAVRAEVYKLLSTTPDEVLPPIVDLLKVIKPANTSKKVQYNTMSNLPEGTIMPSQDGITLGLANGRHPHIDNFYKEDEEIIQMFEGDL